MAEKKIHPNLKAKKPPQNNEAEQAVLGCAMLEEEAAQSMRSKLNREDFYVYAHQVIYDAMADIIGENRPVDIVTVQQQLERAGKTDEAGGLDYLISLTNALPDAANYRYYIDIVKQNGLRRKLISTTADIAEEAYTGEREDILQYAESQIFALGDYARKNDLAPISDALDEAYDRMSKIASDKTAYRGIPSGFAQLDGRLNGFQKGDLVIVAARPGQGKTSLGMNFITNAALSEKEDLPGAKSKIKCAVFSLEMPAEQLARRMLCSVAKVDMKKAANGTMDDSEWRRIRRYKMVLDEAEIYIDDTSMVTPSEIISKCRKLKREKGLDLVMIDYLQLMTSGKRTENRQQEVSEITRSLKIAAKELKVPILLLSQLSRKVEERSDKQPIMSDLRESGAIEQDADIIMFISRKQDTDEAELNIAKFRNGEPGKVPLRWVGAYVSFVDAPIGNEPEKKTETEIDVSSFSDAESMS